MMYETKLILNIWRYEPMTINNMKEKIDNLLSKEPSRWMEKALRDEANGMSQKDLATKTGVSPQQVSKLLKGNENLTLETIAKLEAALGVVLLTLPPSSEINTHNSSTRFSPAQKKSTAKKSGAKTVKVLQQGMVAGQVHETGSGYSKEIT
jgi:plasmid maintenance system antidote protein VapI